MIEFVSKYRTQLMGISILWIMFFHSGIEAPESIVPRAVWYLTVSFGGGVGVNLFLIISGFGLLHSWQKNNILNIKYLHSKKEGGGKSWTLKRLKRILPSYFLVAGLFYLLTASTVPIYFYKLSMLNFLMDGERDFWYIFAILFCYMIFPCIARIGDKYGYSIICGTSFLLCIVFCGLFEYLWKDSFANIEIFLQRIPCFIFGIYIGFCRLYNKKRRANWTIGAMGLVGLLLLISKINPLGNSRMVFTLMTPLAILFFFIIERLPIKSKILGIVLSWFGSRSLEIYLVHVSFGVLLLKKIDYQTIDLLMYFGVSMLMAEMVYQIINYTKKLNVAKYYSSSI